MTQTLEMGLPGRSYESLRLLEAAAPPTTQANTYVVCLVPKEAVRLNLVGWCIMIRPKKCSPTGLLFLNCG